MTPRCATGLLVILAACGVRNVERDTAKSSTRLDLAKDFLRKHQLEAAETESNRALSFNPRNDEAYVIRGLIHMVRAIDTMRTLEIESCLTGVDAEITQRDLDTHLKKADLDFEHATKITPDYGEGWANRGVVHNLLEDYSGASSYFEKALENPMRLDSPGLTRAHLGWSFFTNPSWSKRPRSSANLSSFNPICALQLIVSRGFTSPVRSGKKRRNFSRRRRKTRRADRRKPAST